MTTSPILILGGKGKTGRRVVAQLEAKGVPVRLASRSSERPFDWYDESTWPGISSGVHTAYLAPPVGPTGLAQAGRFVKHAAENGLRRVVLLSGRGVGSPGREFAVYEGQLDLEHAVKGSGADWTIVRPAWFMQGFSEDFGHEYVMAGEIRFSAGTGREIRYVDLDPAEHVAELTAIGVTQEDAESVRDLFAVIRNHRSEYVSHGVEEVLGRAPRDFTDWAMSTAQAGAWSA
jgi:uncharacterized protein YbjT (DUF2867 family)